MLMRKRFSLRASKADVSDDTPRVRRRFLRPRAVIALTMLAGAVVLAFWFYKYNQTPGVGIVRPVVVEERDTKGATSMAHFKSTTIAFDYPTHYATVETKPASSPITEQYMLNMHQPGQESRRVSIAVKRTPATEPFTEDSAYRFRQITVQEYTETAETIKDLPVKKMTKKDKSEVTYFIPGQGTYAIIAATSTRPNPDFEAEITALAQSFVWVR